MYKNLIISKNPEVNWENNYIQFPRLISELDIAGAFTPQVTTDLCDSMSLNKEEICELIGRATETFDKIKEGC